MPKGEFDVPSSIEYGNTLTLKGIKNLRATAILTLGEQTIKEEWISSPKEYVTLDVASGQTLLGKDLSLESLAVLLSLAEARENDEDFKSALDLMFVQIEKGKACSYVAEYDQYLWVPSTFKRNSDGVKPADCGGLFANEDFALLCWDSVNHLPAIRRISLKASLTPVSSTLSTYAKPKRPPIPMEFQTMPSTMSSMMTMTISQPFQSQKPSKLERKETI